MSTVVFDCGCFFMASMYGVREVVSVYLCRKHAQHPDVVEKMNALKALIRDMQEEVKDDA